MEGVSSQPNLAYLVAFLLGAWIATTVFGFLTTKEKKEQIDQLILTVLAVAVLIILMIFNQGQVLERVALAGIVLGIIFCIIAWAGKLVGWWLLGLLGRWE